MKFRLPNNFTHQIPLIIQKAGFTKIFDRKSGQESFVRQPTGERYPRFHLYITENSQEVVFDLHLDQAKTRYSGQTAHNADYASDEVKDELTRLYHAITPFHRKN